MIRVCEPSLSELEIAYVTEALKNNWLSSVAPPVQLFEEMFAKRFGVRHAVATNSGGSALFLALWALGHSPPRRGHPADVHDGGDAGRGDPVRGHACPRRCRIQHREHRRGAHRGEDHA